MPHSQTPTLLNGAPFYASLLAALSAFGIYFDSTATPSRAFDTRMVKTAPAAENVVLVGLTQAQRPTAAPRSPL